MNGLQKQKGKRKEKAIKRVAGDDQLQMDTNKF